MSLPAWPPVILSHRGSAWIRVRDHVLTIAAWCVLGWRTRLGLGMLLDYVTDPLFELTWHAPPDWPVIWAALGPFLGIAALLASWIFIRGRRRHLILAQQFDPTQPASLELDVHAAQWGLALGDMARLRGRRVATVRFEEDGRIVRGQSFAGAVG